MTKTDYIAIANVLNGTVTDSRNEPAVARGVKYAQRHIAMALCEYFAKRDPDFKRDRFLAQSGIQQTEEIEAKREPKLLPRSGE